MHCNAQTDLNLLGRIVALLLALADLADRAGARPHAVRSRALGFLFRAEAAAHAGLCDVARHLGAPASPHVADISEPLRGNSSTDAAQLALRLRALALVWTGLLTWLQRVSRRRARHALRTLRTVLVHMIGSIDTLPVHATRLRLDTS